MLKTFCYQHNTHDNQETQSEHFDSGMVRHKFANSTGKHHHEAYRCQYGCNHDFNLVDHANGCDDGI